ncbi:hypothetical protein AgCh_039860 [Apium graveolens]
MCTDPDTLRANEDKKYRRDDWNVAEHRFSGEVELGTDVAESFCEILKRELNTEHKCYIISPLCWGVNVRSAGLDFHFKHFIHCAGNEKEHANNARHILIRETLDKKLLPEEN